MTFQSEWHALSARILGLRDAALFLSQSSPSGSSRGATEQLDQIARKISEDLVDFYESHKVQLPRFPAPILSNYGRVAGTPHDPRELIAGLLLAKSEVDYLFRDAQAITRRLTERAFEHLQRTIVADSEVRAKWQHAFSGEPACEQLGGAHLLLHGIWAFKANAAGERTDLVLQEPLRDTGQVGRVAEGLVLTEWKRVPRAAALEAKAAEARHQAGRYSRGCLAAVELVSPRYIVLVTQGLSVPSIEDVTAGEVTYRHVCIDVNPPVPSKQRHPPPHGASRTARSAKVHR